MTPNLMIHSMVQMLLHN